MRTVSVGEDERALEVGGGDGCPAMGMCLLPVNGTLKNGSWWGGGYKGTNGNGKHKY